MKIGAIEIYKNCLFFAKVDWILYKIFRIKRTTPCGRTRKDRCLCCELTPTVKNSYIEFDDKGFEIKCKVCGSTHMSTSFCSDDIHNIQDGIDFYYGKGKFEGGVSGKMKRYVDADKLYETARKCHKDFAQSIADLTSLRELLEDTPTADVVAVVRCKDCKYFLDKQIENHQGICMCGEKDTSYAADFYPYADDFCSYGERKDEE